MVDDILLNKVATIENCLKRISEEYNGHENELETHYTRQDSVILNLQRTCEATIDLALHMVRIKGLGLPQESRDAFRMLETAGLLSAELSIRMQAMVGFRNIAVHAYQKLNLVVVRAIIEQHLEEFRLFAKVMINLAK
jgi:uncharacterized protein YutE (UPF0331/DUF86 family)